MMYQNLIRALFIIQFPLICLCHDDGFRDVILSPKDFGGKYIKFNRLVEMTTKIPWEEPLKESAKIALSSPKLSKDAILRAQYMGMKSATPPNSFGDIVIMAKGKLKKYPNESLSFEEIHDVCEYECQNNADKYLQNVAALWMVERIRHRDTARGYRFDLRFTIVPISSEMSGPGGKSNNLEERLRNQMKKTFILRDTDYPKYFQNIAPKSMRRADMQGLMHPNHFMHVAFPQTPKHYSSGERLNTGEYYKKQFPMNKPAPPPLGNFYIPNVNHRYPVRFPDSREIQNGAKNSFYRIKPPMREEEKQEAAQSIVSVVDHRGAVDLNGKQQQSPINANSAQHPKHQSPPSRSSGLYMPQSAIALPIILPQMPMGLVHVAPYTIPLHLQLSTPSNQIIYSQQPDITTFRYPLSYINSQSSQQQQQQQYVPAFQYIPSSNKTSGGNSYKFKESDLIQKGQSFSLPDPIYHPSPSKTTMTTTTEKPPQPTLYTPRGNNYATAASIQINSYDNSDFLPINPPPYLISKNKKPQPVSEGKHSTTEKSKFSNFKNHESNGARNRGSVKERAPKPVTTQAPFATPSPPSSTAASITRGTTTSTSSTFATFSEFPRNHQFHDTSYDVVATRPSVTKRTTTEKPILKWLPKKHRNKTLAGVTSYTAYPTKSTTAAAATKSSPFVATSSSMETAAITAASQSNIHPTIKASTHAQIFRGRNRFYGNRRNSSASPSVTEKSTTAAAAPSALSSTISYQTLKLLKRKPTATTTLLPITTHQPHTPSLVTATTSAQLTTTFPTSSSHVVTSSFEETIEPISYSTSESMQVDNEERTQTTATAASSFELIPAGVEKINTNSSNIQLYRASVLPEASDSEGAPVDDNDESEKLKIDEIATSIINHAKSTSENDRAK